MLARTLSWMKEGERNPYFPFFFPPFLPHILTRRKKKEEKKKKEKPRSTFRLLRLLSFLLLLDLLHNFCCWGEGLQDRGDQIQQKGRRWCVTQRCVQIFVFDWSLCVHKAPCVCFWSSRWSKRKSKTNFLVRPSGLARWGLIKEKKEEKKTQKTRKKSVPLSVIVTKSMEKNMFVLGMSRRVRVRVFRLAGSESRQKKKKKKRREWECLGVSCVLSAHSVLLKTKTNKVITLQITTCASWKRLMKKVSHNAMHFLVYL